MEIHARSRIEVIPNTAPSLDLSPPWEEVQDRMNSPQSVEDKLASEFCYSSRHCPRVEAIGEFARRSFTSGKFILQAALEFNELIHTEFSFDPKATTVSTSVEEVFDKKAGVCQDYAHFQISALRSLGLAARYVSGYIRTGPPPGKPRMIGADASHAWIALYVP